jgi:hypothetical protein
VTTRDGVADTPYYRVAAKLWLIAADPLRAAGHPAMDWFGEDRLAANRRQIWAEVVGYPRNQCSAP